MHSDIGTYDTEAAKNIDLKTILKVLASHGAHKVYAKALSPNDNSKNQPYFGPHLTDLPFIPTGDMVASETTSNKATVKKSSTPKIKYQASVELSWLDTEGRRFPAPNSKLIYYPQYPEVRFSGFLRGSEVDMSGWMDPKREGRSPGRWLILGVANDNRVYAYLVTPASALAHELEASNFYSVGNVFVELTTSKSSISTPREELIAKLLQIHDLGWIPGQKLGPNGVKTPYRAQNGGGYTLEAELGVTPNGYAEPDYLGWEVKQFGVKRFPKLGANVTTLFTPEPNGGIYTSLGVQDFVRTYGYPDKNGVPDRLNVGSVHVANIEQKNTQLTLRILGFDHQNCKITNAKGSVALLDKSNNVAASWSFAKLMDHWKRKHTQAVYVPCLSQKDADCGKKYHYGSDIELGTGTSFEIFLSNMFSGHIYYDPGIKLENASTDKAKSKRRSQFRIKHNNLFNLYQTYETVDIKEQK